MQIPYTTEIIKDLKSKKELKNLDDAFVKNKITDFFSYKSHSQEKDAVIKKLETTKTYKQFTKSKEHEFLIKTIRAELRKIYGVFIKEDFSKRDTLLSQITSDNSDTCLDIVEKLLELHQSTKERAPYYQDAYDMIFENIKILGEKNNKFKILDLGCGMNPVSTIYFKELIGEYIASDISKEDCLFIENFLKRIGISGRAVSMDVTSEHDLKKVKSISVDICFLFKLLDTLERIKLDITPELFKNISAKYIVASFPTESLSGKKVIRHSKRQWFVEFLTKKKFEYQEFLIGNEIFYIIKNNSEKK